MAFLTILFLECLSFVTWANLFIFFLNQILFSCLTAFCWLFRQYLGSQQLQLRWSLSMPAKVVKKMKPIGYPCKYFKKTALIKDIFTIYLRSQFANLWFFGSEYFSFFFFLVICWEYQGDVLGYTVCRVISFIRMLCGTLRIYLLSVLFSVLYLFL